MSKFLSILAIFIIQFFSLNARAEKFHGQYVDWSLFSNQQGKDRICYLLAIPIEKSSGVENRGEPYFIITKTADKIAEISISPGYYYQLGSEVELSFGLKKFNLMTHKSQAWTYQIDDDLEIIKVMKDSDDVIVKSISNRGEVSQDTYSLIGFNKAYRELQKICK